MKFEEANYLSRKRINTIIHIKLIKFSRFWYIISCGILSVVVGIFTIILKNNAIGASLLIAVYGTIFSVFLTMFFNYNVKIDNLTYEVRDIEDKLDCNGYDKIYPKRKLPRD